ncbi:MAG: S66 peptidase family protein [Pseudomonadota bacterium]
MLHHASMTKNRAKPPSVNCVSLNISADWCFPELALQVSRMNHMNWTTALKKPGKLRHGDRVMVVTPCWGGPSLFPHVFDAGVSYLEQTFGLEVVEAPQARADDLMMAFEDAAVKGIFASIGGDDSIRILPFLNLDIIAQNPKVFIGYSDVTSIHFACLKAGISTFYGPSIMSGFAENLGMTRAGKDSFERAVFQSKPIGLLPKNSEGWTVEMLDWSNPATQNCARKRIFDDGLEVLQGTGTHAGRLIGGCAEVLETLKATTWWPTPDYWDGAVLFYETSEEAPSADSVRRWMRNYAAQGILDRLSGLIVARPGGSETTSEYRRAQKDAIMTVISEHGLVDLPVFADADIGHTDPIYTLPFGARVALDCDSVGIEILESGVTK